MMFTRKRIYAALGATLILAGAGGYTVWRGQGDAAINQAHAAAHGPTATEVDVATVVSKTITDWQSYSGRLEAVNHVDIRPLVPGTIVAVHFKDGALVKGDPLFTIDPRPYEAEVDRAQAQLAAAQARNGYTSTDAARAERLLADNAIAKRDYDEKQNAAREAVANLKAAQAALEAAKINLAYTHIVAPVSGRVSRAELTVGNIVSTGANAPLLTTLVSVSPIYASFDVDEQTYLRYLGAMRAAPCLSRWASLTRTAIRVKASSIRSITGSTRRPAPSACVRASTTRMARSCRGSTRASRWAAARPIRQCSSTTPPSAPIRTRST